LTKLDATTGQNLLIVPGYIASTKEGLMTTLKRNGSDLSAAIYGVLLDAAEVNIWTDVDGLYSANPRRVPDAVILDRMSYLETLELAYFGAEVLHPSAISPAMYKNIPVIIRNTFNPTHPGTRIYQITGNKLDPKLVKGFAAIDSVALINLEGSGMIGVPGISKKLFSALTEADISVMMISQASSEYSICIVVTEQDGPKAQQVVKEAFEFEIQQGHILSINLETDVGILAAIGDMMVHQPGIAAIFFNALSRARINIRMISQGSSERNISVILEKKDMTRALQAAHSAFYLSHLTLSVGIIGIGLIGETLLDQIREQLDKLRSEFNIDLRINGLANSSSMLLQRQISVTDWKTDFDNNKTPLEIDEFAKFVNTDSIPHAVIMDCTASQEIADYYERWLNQGIHVITPNKKANSDSFEKYKILQIFIYKGPSTNPLDKTTHYFYETTAGAGLPIISTLQDLIKTGDKVIEIEGVLSGTLSFIFNNLSDKQAFSEIVKLAKKEGYTEPDPRDDLSGLDIARKLVILAREMGLETEVDDVKIEKLLPESSFQATSIDIFLEDLPSYDQAMSQKVSEAASKDEVLRYVGVIKANGECDIQLKSYSKTHPFANLRGSENVVLFKTERYQTYPLIVQGPGAGAAVTAAGVFAELLRLADLLGNS
ncbi:MAG: bifunctional aspartate kinase/homoserine dehydrogenase I, partial [Candidatus Heimdallarchaeota archaeon]|nr:bifunctional aspartate kinase/homoserine dehydrogenase I [Candidatus Heimdallarchaeota archaeon]